MSKYRFKTEEEFKEQGYWLGDQVAPKGWFPEMLKYLGKNIKDEHIPIIEVYIGTAESFKLNNYYFNSWDFTLNIEEPNLSIEETLTQITPLTTKTKTNMKKAATKTRSTEKFVFMDKTVQILDIGFNTCKNIVLYGPGE